MHVPFFPSNLLCWEHKLINRAYTQRHGASRAFFFARFFCPITQLHNAAQLLWKTFRHYRLLYPNSTPSPSPAQPQDPNTASTTPSAKENSPKPPFSSRPPASASASPSPGETPSATTSSSILTQMIHTAMKTRLPHPCRVFCDRVGILTPPLRHPMPQLCHPERSRGTLRFPRPASGASNSNAPTPSAPADTMSSPSTQSTDKASASTPPTTLTSSSPTSSLSTSGTS